MSGLTRRLQQGVAADSFVMDFTRPTANNTGLAATGLTVDDLTLYDGNITVNTTGTVIENQLIRGQIKVNNISNVTIRNCKIVGRPQATEFCSAMIETVGTNILIENCELTCYDDTQTPAVDNSKSADGYIISAGVNAIGTGTTTVRRCNIHDTVDGVTFYGGNSGEAAGNYIHDFNFRTDDSSKATSTPAYWSHNDGIQIGAGVGQYFHGNHIDQTFSTVTGMGSQNPDLLNCQVMLLQSNTAIVTNLRIEYNWIVHGHLGLNFSTSSADLYGGTCALFGNRFTPDQLGYSGNGDWPCQIYSHPNSSWTITGAGTSVYTGDSDTPAQWRGQPIQASVTSGDGTATLWQFNPNLSP